MHISKCIVNHVREAVRRKATVQCTMYCVWWFAFVGAIWRICNLCEHMRTHYLLVRTHVCAFALALFTDSTTFNVQIITIIMLIIIMIIVLLPVCLFVGVAVFFFHLILHILIFIFIFANDREREGEKERWVESVLIAKCASLLFMEYGSSNLSNILHSTHHSRY